MHAVNEVAYESKLAPDGSIQPPCGLAWWRRRAYARDEGAGRANSAPGSALHASPRLRRSSRRYFCRSGYLQRRCRIFTQLYIRPIQASSKRQACGALAVPPTKFTERRPGPSRRGLRWSTTDRHQPSEPNAPRTHDRCVRTARTRCPSATRLSFMHVHRAARSSLTEMVECNSPIYISTSRRSDGPDARDHPGIICASTLLLPCSDARFCIRCRLHSHGRAHQRKQQPGPIAHCAADTFSCVPERRPLRPHAWWTPIPSTRVIPSVA